MAIGRSCSGGYFTATQTRDKCFAMRRIALEMSLEIETLNRAVTTITIRHIIFEDNSTFKERDFEAQVKGTIIGI